MNDYNKMLVIEKVWNGELQRVKNDPSLTREERLAKMTEIRDKYTKPYRQMINNIESKAFEKTITAIFATLLFFIILSIVIG